MSALILVTGAAGRIGRVVVEGVRSAGLPVRATDILSLPDVDCPGDIRDSGFVQKLVQGCSAIIHLAGHPNSRDWSILDELNIGATRTLLDAAGAAGVSRFVFASSVHAAGLEPADAYLHANMPISADSPYGVSKVMGEALLHHACFRYAMSGVALRICAFRPEPGNARELRLWLSPRDMAALALASISAPLSGVETVWGISANRRAAIDRAVWERIGYAPLDEAEDHLDVLRAAGVDGDLVSEWPLLGGPVAETTLCARD